MARRKIKKTTAQKNNEETTGSTPNEPTKLNRAQRRKLAFQKENGDKSSSDGSNNDNSSGAPQENTAAPIVDGTTVDSDSDDSQSHTETAAAPQTPQEDDTGADANSISTEESESGSESGSGSEPSHPPSSTPTPAPAPTPYKSDGRYHNKRRCLILSSRGITSRQRHLLEDFRTLIPHHKKEGKLDVGKNSAGGIGGAINDICEMRGCNSVLFLECRKRQDAYLWIGGGPPNGAGGGGQGGGVGGGPSAKFLVENVHTMDELRLTGNCMKGSRPILAFDAGFGGREELRLLKCLFTDAFGTPRGHPKSKPFVDRVMGFYYVDGKIWVRNYQIVETTSTTAKEAHTQKKLHGQAHSTSMVEIGPRFVLNPIRIFRGSFGGQTLYQNPAYVSPNAIRSARARSRGEDYRDRKEADETRKRRREDIVVPEDPLGKVFA